MRPKIEIDSGIERVVICPAEDTAAGNRAVRAGTEALIEGRHIGHLPAYPHPRLFRYVAIQRDGAWECHSAHYDDTEWRAAESLDALREAHGIEPDARVELPSDADPAGGKDPGGGKEPAKLTLLQKLFGSRAADRREEVVAAILELRSEGADFGPDGVPNVAQINAKLAGFTVTAAQRDAVLDSMADA